MSDLVERLRALAEKATPGPWQVNGVRSKMRLAFGDHTFPVHDVGPDGDALAAVFFEEKTGRGFIDAKFIASCDPQTILALIGRITALEGERDTATRALGEMRKAGESLFEVCLRASRRAFDGSVFPREMYEWRAAVAKTEEKG